MPRLKAKKPPHKRIFQRLGPFFHRRATQRVAVSICLIAAVGVQYRLVYMPVADLQDTHKFKPASLKAGEKVASFVDPQTDDPHFNFSFDQPAESGQPNMIVDAYFDKAALSDQTVQRLTALGLQVPSGLASISYLNVSDGHAECRTEFTVETTASAAAAVQFAQNENAPSERHRLIDIKMTGYDSTVTLASAGGFGPGAEAQCHIDLKVGSWTEKTEGFMPIKLQVPAGNGFRFRWALSDIKLKGWPTEGKAQSLLRFGTHSRESFRAREIKIFPFGGHDSDAAKHGLDARSIAAADPLTIDSLQIAADRIEVYAEGKGRTIEDGKVMSSADLLAAITQNPLLALLLTALNAALVNWARRAFFGSSYSGKY
jgi:hypothetical protein